MSAAKLEQKCRACVAVFAVTLGVSVALVITGFIVPPTGVIDGSVLNAVGELLAFAALAVGSHAITLGYDLKLQKGDTSITLNNDEKHD